MPLARHLVVGSLGLLLAALVALTTLWNLGVAPRSLGIQVMIPEDPDLAEGALLNLSPQARLRVSSRLKARLRSAARLDPLGDKYLSLAAIDLRREGDLAGSIAALEEARQRNPRDRFTRLMLAEAYFENTDARKAAVELTSLERLSRGAGQALLPILQRMVLEEETREPTLQALAGSRLNFDLAALLARDHADPALILSVLANLPSPGDNEDRSERVANLITPYIEAGDLEAAARLWRGLNGGSRADLTEVTDAQFEARHSPPFGWAIDTGSAGIAELANGSLKITYYGRSGWVIARQLVMLRPGAYRLEYAPSAQGANPPNLAWRVDCLESGATLLNLPLKRDAAFGLEQTNRFTVPSAGCPAQWLALTARPTEGARNRSFVMRKVELLPSGGA